MGPHRAVFPAVSSTARGIDEVRFSGTNSYGALHVEAGAQRSPWIPRLIRVGRDRNHGERPTYLRERMHRRLPLMNVYQTRHGRPGRRRPAAVAAAVVRLATPVACSLFDDLSTMSGRFVRWVMHDIFNMKRRTAADTGATRSCRSSRPHTRRWPVVTTVRRTPRPRNDTDPLVWRRRWPSPRRFWLHRQALTDGRRGAPR